MMVETVVDVMSKQHGAQYAHALIQMQAGVEQPAHKQQQALQIQQQLEDNAPAPLHGLVMHIVMMSITTSNAAMMVETVADVTSTLTGAQFAHALIQMEMAVEQLAHLLQQQLKTQAIMR